MINSAPDADIRRAEHTKSLESSSDRYPDPMTEAARRGTEEPPVKWLTAAELYSWLSVVRLITWLPWSIDQQLQRDSNLGMVEYQVLAMLSESPQRTMRMSSLAEVTERIAVAAVTPGQTPRAARPGAPRARSHRRTIHQRHLDREGLPDTRRSSTRTRGTCAITHHRRLVPRAAAAPRPRRRPHNVAHRHLWNQLALHRIPAERSGGLILSVGLRRSAPRQHSWVEDWWLQPIVVVCHSWRKQGSVIRTVR